MLKLAGNDMPAPLHSSLCNALERQIVRLGRTGRPDYLRGLCADKIGNLLTGLFDSLPSLLTV